MANLKDSVVSTLWRQSVMRLALLVVPVILVGYGIAAFEILRSRGASRRRRVAVGVVIGLNIPLFLIWATEQFDRSETLLVLGLPASLIWMGWDSLKSVGTPEPEPRP